MECGGILNANSCGLLPQNQKQISNLKETMKPEPPEKGPLLVVMEQCKKEQSCTDPFLRVVQAAPAMSLLASDHQLHDLSKFCTDPEQCTILGIEPTFNLGEFLVTVTTYTSICS